MEFEKGRAATEGKVFRQIGMAEDLHQGAADDQVLFHLIILGPGGSLLPFGYEVLWDQISASTRVFTRIFHGFNWLIPSKGRDGVRGVGSGFFSEMNFANFAVFFCAPTSSSR